MCVYLHICRHRLLWIFVLLHALKSLLFLWMPSQSRFGQWEQLRFTAKLSRSTEFSYLPAPTCIPSPRSTSRNRVAHLLQLVNLPWHVLPTRVHSDVNFYSWCCTCMGFDNSMTGTLHCNVIQNSSLP